LNVRTKKKLEDGTEVSVGAYHNGVTLTQIAIGLFNLLKNPNPDGFFFINNLFFFFVDPLSQVWCAHYKSNKAEYEQFGFFF
jgi:hypothetical protein